MNTYISLDLETTGFDNTKDQLIEFAAIKYNDNGIIETLNTLINPQIPIPPMVSYLTGIKDEDLSSAPLFNELEDKIKAFLGNYPIVGHNISFDVNFLNQKGLGLINPLYDTLQLSGILLPGLPSYSLDTITRTLKISHENKHRAYDDALACYELFKLIKEKIDELSEETLNSIKQILTKSSLPYAELFENAKGRKPSTQKKDQETNTVSIGTKQEFKEIDYLEFYDPSGALSKVIKNYEPRPTQKQMSAKIQDALMNNKKLLIEAGTGTGKTFAYLLPSLYKSINSQEQVIISTYTKNLQEQIVEKDIPILQKALKTINPDLGFKTALLKGRKNYLSEKRLETFLNKDIFEEFEAIAAIKLIIWAKQTKTGHLDEVSLQNKEFTILDDICCQESLCPHDDPEYANNCWLIKARKQAEDAHVIVVNHALLLQNVFSDSPILPTDQYKYLIVDEAHHLEKVATETLTTTLSLNSFLKPYEKLIKNLRHLQNEPTDLFKQEEQVENINNIIQQISNLINKIEIFFGLLGIFIEKNLDINQFNYQLTIKAHNLTTKEWAQTTESANTVKELSQNILKKLDEINEELFISTKLSKEIYNSIYECKNKITDLKLVFNGQGHENQILWIVKNNDGIISLKCAPLEIGEAIQKSLIDNLQSTILTSATLTTDGNFNFYKSQLGLKEETATNFETLIIPSHFKYPDQVKILIPDDLPEPATEGNFASCCQVIKDIIIKNQGKTLVLFTNKKTLTATYMQIAVELKEKGIELLGQGITGSRGKILEHFKDEPEKSAIMGLDSFWEGVDLAGKLLTCVVIQKIPFDPPDDPIIQNRGLKYQNSFDSYQIPRAILKFKQGFGRLIRTSEDTGSIVILDTRIIQKNYGLKFLEALPDGIKIEYANSDQIADLL